MNIVFSYGVIGGGGCERRMGDLVRWFLANGDEAWIVGSCINTEGRSQLFGQQGIPPERILLCDPEVLSRSGLQGYADFVGETCRALKADILDVQYVETSPVNAPCRTIFTMHGLGQPIPAILFDGILSVESMEPPSQFPSQPFAHASNWVDATRFPFRSELGEGACFIGRNFKTVNALKVASLWDGTIDCYGIAEVPIAGYPDNMRWLGYTDPAETLPRYRVVFASAQVALEALSVGRFVIAGQHYVWPPAGLLVTPGNIRLLADNQFYTVERSSNIGEPSAEEVYLEFREAMEDDAPRERQYMSQYVRKHHDPDTQMQKIRQFYEEVLA